MPQGSAARLAVTLFALLAFALQSYVTQVHIHGLARVSFPAASHGLGKSTAQKQQPDKFPAGGDPANCPICQEILHAGYYVTPSAAASLPLAMSIPLVAIAVSAATFAQTYSHSWKSRAPPLV